MYWQFGTNRNSTGSNPRTSTKRSSPTLAILDPSFVSSRLVRGNEAIMLIATNFDIALDRDSPIFVQTYLSAIFDDTKLAAVILDERKGIYWRVSGNALYVLLYIVGYPKGCPLKQIAKIDNLRPDELTTTVDWLKKANLIIGPNNSDIFRPRTNWNTTKLGNNPPASSVAPSETKMLEMSLDYEPRQPRLRLVIYYIAINIMYRLRLYFTGWLPVWKIRSQQPGHLRVPLATDSDVNQAIEEVIAAGRLACLVPFVRSDCVPRSLTMHKLLRTLGYSPALLIGGTIEAFEPHIWVELNGIRIDSGILDNSLDIFEALS